MSFLKKFSQKQIRIIALFMIIAVSAVIFFEVVNDIFIEPLEGDVDALTFDKNALKLLQTLRSDELTQSMIDITSLGSFSVVTLLSCIVIIFLTLHKDWKGLMYIVLMAAGAGVIPDALKNYFMRERPDALGHLARVSTGSFPSGHSFGATVTYLSLAYLLTRELKVLKLEFLYYGLAVIVIALVGVSRMYLGVHFPTDVIGGICCGLIWFSLVSIPFIYYGSNRESI